MAHRKCKCLLTIFLLHVCMCCLINLFLVPQMASINGSSSGGCGSCSDGDLYRLALKLLAFNSIDGMEGSLKIGDMATCLGGQESRLNIPSEISLRQSSSRSISSPNSGNSSSPFLDDSSTTSDCFSAELNSRNRAMALGEDHDGYSSETLSFSSYTIDNSNLRDYDEHIPTSSESIPNFNSSFIDSKCSNSYHNGMLDDGKYRDRNGIFCDDSYFDEDSSPLSISPSKASTNSFQNIFPSLQERSGLDIDISLLSLNGDTHSEFHCNICFKRIYALAAMIANKNTLHKTSNRDDSLLSNESNTSDILVTGPGIRRATRGRTSIFHILIPDASTAVRTSMEDSLVVNILDPNGYQCGSTKVSAISPGKFAVRYKPNFEGIYQAMISVHSEQIKGSPFTIQVSSHHKYQISGEIKSIIEGDEGTSWAFNKPWGICCNSEGYVFVGDRGNHSIKVFSPNLIYSRSIGSKGSQPGKLNKPAGVTINTLGEIVVADKDNHRIQIFNFDGKVESDFGDDGLSEFQLNYPWDVTVGPNNCIFVSDSRHGRVSLFSSGGDALSCFDLDSNVLKSPRGIYFREIDGRVITTDMIRHQIVVIDVSEGMQSSSSDCNSSSHPSLIGRKGTASGELHRPQGVTCDSEGNIIVCDSINERIQIFDADGNYLTQWSLACSDPSKSTQPTGVEVSPFGNILVVDAEQNRILVY